MIYDSGTNKLPSNCNSADLSECDVKDTGNMAAYPVNDFRKTGSDVYELKIITEYTSPVENKVYSVDSQTLSCQSYTMNPTMQPTSVPTVNPSENPTKVPTLNPTTL